MRVAEASTIVLIRKSPFHVEDTVEIRSFLLIAGIPEIMITRIPEIMITPDNPEMI